MRGRQREVRAVVTFAFVVVGKTDKTYYGSVETLCFVYRFGKQFFVVSVAFERVGVRIIEFFAACGQAIGKRYEFIGIYTAAA